MQLTGEEIIDAPIEKVWQGLNDPEILRACIKGCTKIEKSNDTDFLIEMTATVGPVKAKFKGKIILNDLNPPNSYTITFNGSGGVAGFGKGTANVELFSTDEKTTLRYHSKATVGGKLAQVGARLIDGVAKKIASDFFFNLNEKLSTSNLDIKGNLDQDIQNKERPPWIVWILGTASLFVIWMVFSYLDLL